MRRHARPDRPQKSHGIAAARFVTLVALSQVIPALCSQIRRIRGLLGGRVAVQQPIIDFDRLVQLIVGDAQPGNDQHALRCQIRTGRIAHNHLKPFADHIVTRK